jgi:hypothetical protein
VERSFSYNPVIGNLFMLSRITSSIRDTIVWSCAVLAVGMARRLFLGPGIWRDFTRICPPDSSRFMPKISAS